MTILVPFRAPEMRLPVTILIICLFSTTLCRSQSGIRDSLIGFPLLSVTYGIYAPGGDFADRFGTTSILGGEFLYKTKKNWIFGITGGALFGSDVTQENLLQTIASDNGQIIGLDGLYADVRVFERGYHFTTTIGKIIHFKKPNPNSGIMLTAGPGFLQHKIRIENIGNTVPQLQDDYLKGYDYLTNGLELREFIGYVYFSNRQLLNFQFGFEFIQAFTSNRRDYNFDNPDLDDSNRIELLYGVKLGWILPLYKKKPAAYYLY